MDLRVIYLPTCPVCVCVWLQPVHVHFSNFANSLSAKNLMKPPEGVIYRKTNFRGLVLRLAESKAEFDRSPEGFLLPVVMSKEHPSLICVIQYKHLDFFIKNLATKFQEYCAAFDVPLEKFEKHKLNVPQVLFALVSSPEITFTEDSAIAQLHRLFVVNQMRMAFVTKNGKLIGTVHRQSITDAINKGKRSVWSIFLKCCVKKVVEIEKEIEKELEEIVSA